MASFRMVLLARLVQKNDWDDLVILAGCLLIPCFIPLLIRVVTGFIETVVERRMAT